MEQTNSGLPAGKQKQNLSVFETAEILGVTSFAVRAWIARRIIGHRKLGRAVRVPREEVERMLHDSYTPPMPERR
jgi:excisionase family DNA binding protein